MFEAEKSKIISRVATYGQTIDGGAERILLYGLFGCGKTQLFAQWPDVLFMDIDKGENKYLVDHGIRKLDYPNEDNIHIPLIADLQKCLKAEDVFDPNGGPLGNIKSLCLDSWSKLNEMLYLNAICENDKLEVADDKAGFDEYGKLLKRQMLIMKYLKQISIRRDMAILVTALARLEGDEAEQMQRDKKQEAERKGFDKIVGKPDLIGAYRDKIGAEFTDVWYIERSGNPLKYTIWTVPHKGYTAKSRFDMPESFDVPKDNAYAKIRAMLDKGREKALAQGKTLAKPAVADVPTDIEPLAEAAR